MSQKYEESELNFVNDDKYDGIMFTYVTRVNLSDCTIIKYVHTYLSVGRFSNVMMYMRIENRTKKYAQMMYE